MNGKDKCRILKDIRRQIAEENDIEWVVSECRHKGNCKGTCPRCESEVRKLERELERKRRLGKSVVIAGISAACIAGLAACTGPTPGSIFGGLTTTPPIEDIAGEIDTIAYEPTQTPGTEEDLNGTAVPIEDIELSGDVAVEDFGND